MEAADLGVRLCQTVWPSVYRCYWIALLPVGIFTLATFEIATWLPSFALWWMKPWLDRTILFVLSRAAFGQTTTIGDLWRAQRHIWWGQWLRTLTTRRLSPWRAFTQPVYQLEGQTGSRLRRRVAQIRRGNTGSALLMTSAFSLVEMVFWASLLSLVYWFAPPGHEIGLMELFEGTLSPAFALGSAGAYLIAIALLEPFYVASGFAMYLNRRVELEAWDIEQEFRRAFPR